MAVFEPEHQNREMPGLTSSSQDILHELLVLVSKVIAPAVPSHALQISNKYKVEVHRDLCHSKKVPLFLLRNQESCHNVHTPQKKMLNTNRHVQKSLRTLPLLEKALKVERMHSGDGTERREICILEAGD